MKIWVDAHLSPAVAIWLSQSFCVEAIALRDIGLRDSEDEQIFVKARSQGAVIRG